MKAILEYHGFTKEVEAREGQDIYEIHIPPTDKRYDDALKNGDPYFLNMYMNKPFMPKHHYLIFKIAAITEVDSEKVAIYELYEER